MNTMIIKVYYKTDIGLYIVLNFIIDMVLVNLIFYYVLYIILLNIVSYMVLNFFIIPSVAFKITSWGIINLMTEYSLFYIFI